MKALTGKGTPWANDSGHLKRPRHQFAGWEMARQQREAYIDRLGCAEENER